MQRNNNNSTNSSWHISKDTKAMQQHLTLLFHARKCPHDEDHHCPVTPQCSDAKRIWRHIANCHNRKCRHCYSSRYVLTHFRECKDYSSCVICLPVREEMARRRMQVQHEQGIVKMNYTMGTTSTSPSTTDDVTPNLHEDGKAAVTQVTPLPTPQDTTATNTNNVNPMPTLTVAICRSSNNVGRVIPVSRTRSFSSFSSLSGCSSAFSSNLSTRSSAWSNSGSGRRNNNRYSNRSVGAKSCPHVTCGGIKCRENLGIAHFIKEEP